MEQPAAPELEPPALGRLLRRTGKLLPTEPPADRSARADRLPESRQTRFHEEYARHLAQDSLFWGIWIDQLADYGSSRRPYGVNARGLVGLDRCERKDAFYLYKALWNRETPTLHIAERRLRDGTAARRACGSTPPRASRSCA